LTAVKAGAKDSPILSLSMKGAVLTRGMCKTADIVVWCSRAVSSSDGARVATEGSGAHKSGEGVSVSECGERGRASS
jgi:hypothetical protein